MVFLREYLLGMSLDTSNCFRNSVCRFTIFTKTSFYSSGIFQNRRKSVKVKDVARLGIQLLSETKFGCMKISLYGCSKYYEKDKFKTGAKIFFYPLFIWCLIFHGTDDKGMNLTIRFVLIVRYNPKTSSIY